MYNNLFSEQSTQDLLSALPGLPTSLWETFYVTVLSTALALVIGLPLGVLLVTGEKDGVLPLPVIFLLMFLCAFAGAGLIAHALALLVRRAAALQQESELTI